MGRTFFHQGYKIIVERRGDIYYAYRTDRHGSVAKARSESFDAFMSDHVTKTTQFDRTSYEEMDDSVDNINIKPRSKSDSYYVVAVKLEGVGFNGEKVEYTGYSSPIARRGDYEEAKREAEQVGRANMSKYEGTPTKVVSTKVERYTPLILR